MGNEEISSWVCQNYEMLSKLMNCIKVGIYIADGNGKTLLLNNESCKTGGLKREEILGRGMQELVDIGYMEESAVLKVLNTRKEQSFVQSLGDGGKIFITGTPLYEEKDIKIVVCTERDVTEAMTLRSLLQEKDAITEKYENEIEYLKTRDLVTEGDIICDSKSMKDLIKEAYRVAVRDATVLLTGESGTGKELFANLIYKNSLRVGEPFIKVNCAAVPETLMESEMFGYEKGAFTGAGRDGKIGFFELAHRGTLFLDEIGDLQVHMQSKILRALQEKEIIRVGGTKTVPVDIRVIAATNRDLWKAVTEGSFRRDLYYRLNVIRINIPPLRDRRGDIDKLSLYFTHKFSQEYKIEKQIETNALSMLREHEWPGNVRELKNVIERLIVGNDKKEITKLQVQQLLNSEHGSSFSLIEKGIPLKQLVEHYEKHLLESAMKQLKNAAEVSRALNIDKATLSRRLRKYGIV